MHISNRHFYLLVGITAFILLFRLDYLPLIFEEPRRALVSLEMILTGNFLMPTINGYEYYNKPPVYNWLLSGFFKLFGYSEWVVRLPTYLSFIAITLINYRFFKSRMGDQAAALGSLFFLLSAHVLFYFSFIGEIDIFYTLLVYQQILCFFYFYHKQQYWLLFLVTYLLMSVGFLTKGLPSIAFQGLTIIGFAVHKKSFRFLFHPANVLFLFLSLGIIALYFSLYSQYSDPWPYLAQLISESSRRTSSGPIDWVTNIFRVVLELLKITFPWVLLSMVLIPKSNRLAEKNVWVLYCMIFLAANLWLYLISPGTKDRYMYMFLPFVYNLLAYQLTPLLKPKARYFSIVAWGFIGLLCALFAFISWQYQQSWIALLIIVLTGMLLFFLLRKKKVSPLLALFMLMILGRVAYDFVVFPQRKSDTREGLAKIAAQKVINQVGHQELYFYTEVQFEKKNLWGFKTDKPEIGRLPYNLTYYIASERRSIIHATESVSANKYYLSQQKNTPDRAEVLYEFRLEDKDWVLFANRN